MLYLRYWYNTTLYLCTYFNKTSITRWVAITRWPLLYPLLEVCPRGISLGQPRNPPPIPPPHHVDYSWVIISPLTFILYHILFVMCDHPCSVICHLYSTYSYSSNRTFMLYTSNWGEQIRHVLQISFTAANLLPWGFSKDYAEPPKNLEKYCKVNGSGQRWEEHFILLQYYYFEYFRRVRSASSGDNQPTGIRRGWGDIRNSTKRTEYKEELHKKQLCPI